MSRPRSYICVSSSPYFGQFPSADGRGHPGGQGLCLCTRRVPSLPGLPRTAAACLARRLGGLGCKGISNPTAGIIKKAFPDCSVKIPFMTAPKWLVYAVRPHAREPPAQRRKPPALHLHPCAPCHAPCSSGCERAAAFRRVVRALPCSLSQPWAALSQMGPLMGMPRDVIR